jgi:hypothetical protein
MSFLSSIQNFVNTVVPKLESKVEGIESNPAGKVGLDILKQLASSIFSKDGKGGLFSEKLTLSLPNPLAKLNKFLADIGAKFLNGGDFLKNIGNFLTGNRTLENGSQVTVPRLQDRAQTSATTSKDVASSIGNGAYDTTIKNSTSGSTSTSTSASTLNDSRSSGSVLTQIEGSGSAFDWKTLTGAQSEMLAESGIKPGTPEYNRMVLQFKMQNYAETMQLISNIAKQLSDISKSIIRNIS